MFVTVHCPERRCNEATQIDFCGKPETACTCGGLLFCLHCGVPLDYETLHAEADYWASLRAGE